MPRLALLILILLISSLAPVAAQDDAFIPANWVPADFDSFIRVDLTDHDQADPFTPLDSLNLSMYVASHVQPARVIYSRWLTFTDFFPLAGLDTEGVTFEDNILPWLGDDVILAYRDFGPSLNVSNENLLMILPTRDAFTAASFLSPIIKAQDFPKRATYRDASLFIGDLTTIALAPDVVLVGSQADVQAALDAEAGSAPRLADTPEYKAVSAALPSDDFLFGYVDGAQSLRALSVLLNGNDSGMPLLEALGGAIRQGGGGTLEADLLTGAAKGIGLSVSVNNLNRTIHAQAAVFAGEQPAAAAFDQAVIQILPRNAMLVQSGVDARSAFTDALYGLPMSNFVSAFAGGFIPPQEGTTLPGAPSVDEMISTVDSFIGVLQGLKQFDLKADLTAHVGGSYALALLPRPNNPSPVSGAPYDVLIAAQTTDGAAATKGATTLAQIALGIAEADFAPTEIDGVTFNTAMVAATDETVLSIGTVDNLLLIGTGDAVADAMRARSGDNRLMNVDRWKEVSGSGTPLLYADLNALHNTFLPNPGGSTTQMIGRLSVNVTDHGGGVTLFDIIAKVPVA